MTNEEAKKMLEAKLECLIAETSGTNHDCNMRLCDGCSLNYEQGNMGEQKEALDMAIKALEQTELEPSYNSIKPELDCISREAVEKITWEEPSYTDALNVLTEVREKVRALPSVTPKAEWIPCSERLPASDEDVLVTNGRGVYIGWIDNADMIWRVDSESEYFMYDIVAWMPLPEPFREEDSNGSES